jgi:peptidoglycan/LPS O-acetylase OafA/YrhL
MIAEVCLSGVAILWSISPSARQSAAYGPMPSQVVLAVSMLLTAAGAGAVWLGSRLSRAAKLAITLVLASTAGGVLPLALTALLPAKPGGYGLLLILAVIGMAGVAGHIPRTTHPPST